MQTKSMYGETSINYYCHDLDHKNYNCNPVKLIKERLYVLIESISYLTVQFIK